MPILLLFLKSLRATLIAALSIPLSLIISFVFLYLTGDTLNLMSLGGLAVAIGLIIDDTVVVIENIARHLAEGQTGDAAVDRASREISGAVIGSTLTTILVFVPLAFVRGVVGQFFQSLSLSLTVALVVSMVVSLTIIPVLAARFLGRRADADDRPDLQPAGRRLRGAAEGRAPVPDRLARARWRCWRSCRAGGCATHLETGFMPDMDEGAFVLDYNMPVGTSLAQTDKVHAPGRGRARRTRPTSPATSAGPGPSSGSSPPSRTPATSWSASSRPAQRRPAEEIFDALREELKAEVPELETEFVPLVQDQINDLAGVDSPIEVKVFGPDFATLRTLAEQVGKIVEEVPGAADVNAARLPRQSRHRDPARQRPDGPGRPDRAGRRVSAQRRALRPGGQHGPRAGPDDQDPRSLPRPGPVRPRAPGPAADQPGDRDARHRRREPRGGRRDRLRPARPTRDDPYRPQPQRAVARKPAAGHHRHRRAGKPRPGLGQPRAASEARRS